MQQFRALHLSQRRAQAAFTLVEVMVAMSIFALVTASMMSAFTRQMRWNTESERNMGASAVAQQVLDSLRIVDPTTMPASGTAAAQNIVLGDRTYNVYVTYCPTGTTFCTSDNVRHIRVRVDYRLHTLFTTETVYAALR